jgi:hypothetical protein
MRVDEFEIRANKSRRMNESRLTSLNLSVICSGFFISMIPMAEMNRPIPNGAIYKDQQESDSW